jgi:hypothetical protein
MFTAETQRAQRKTIRNRKGAKSAKKKLLV